MEADRAFMRDALDAGASGYVLKERRRERAGP